MSDLHDPNLQRGMEDMSQYDKRVQWAAFVVVGCIPLLPFLLQVVTPNAVANPFLWSISLTAAAFFGVGAVKSRFVEQRWYSSGLETLLIGGSAAILAYLVGILLTALT